MDSLLGLLDSEFIKNSISTVTQGEFTKDLVLVGIILKVLSRRVGSIENAIKDIGAEISKLKLAVEKDFSAQSARLGVLEGNVIELKTRVTHLEK